MGPLFRFVNILHLLILLSILLPTSFGTFPCDACVTKCDKTKPGRYHPGVLYGRSDNPPNKQVDDPSFCKKCRRICAFEDAHWGGFGGSRRNTQPSPWRRKSNNLHPEYYNTGRSSMQPWIIY